MVMASATPEAQQAYEAEALRGLHQACADLWETYKNPRRLDGMDSEARFRLMLRLHAPILDHSLKLIQRAHPQGGHGPQGGFGAGQNHG